MAAVSVAAEAETVSDKEKWENTDFEQDSQEEEQEEEEEALSLCDLPINLIEENGSSKEEIEADNQENEDFNFKSWDETNISTNSEMCAADDIFFQGQILPFRLLVSSESNYAINSKSLKQETLNLSRSESLDRVSAGGFTSTFSSRSSSSSGRSQISSNSSTITSNSEQKNSRNSNPTRIQNQFHTHPSPKPQIRNSNSNISSHSRNRKSNTTWDIFRVGLIRTPEIEFQDLKIRNSVSRNNSSGSSNSSSTKSNPRGKKQRKQSLMSGCSCKVTAVKPVAAINSKTSKKLESKQKQRKQEMSGHRTFEWIKELSSHANFLDHKEGHIQS